MARRGAGQSKLQNERLTTIAEPVLTVVEMLQKISVDLLWGGC
jgi:hypothetical protein